MNYVLSLMKEIIGKRKLIWDLGKADFRDVAIFQFLKTALNKTGIA